MKARSQGGKRNTTKEAMPSCFSSSCPGQNSKCCNKALELACSACILCVSCPLSIVWCCIKLPCTIAWRAAKRVSHGACFSSEKRILSAYSSFSDIDSPRNSTQQRGSRSAGSWISK
ncbi:hypothetical protein AAG906_013973 [Vitis piasezkii]